MKAFIVVMVAAVCGLLFGLGLIIAGMANPANVLAFLDLSGEWNPSLALVMIGGIAVAILPFAWARTRRLSVLGTPMQLPTKRQIDVRLIGGSLLFGVGWGIAGICPGPGLVLLGAGVAKGAGFVLAMLVGMWIVGWIEQHRAARS